MKMPSLSLPDIYESEKNILNEALWSTDQTLFAMDYLPFFSACRGHDSHIYLQHITETNYQPVTFGTDQTFVSYGESTLVPLRKLFTLINTARKCRSRWLMN